MSDLAKLEAWYARHCNGDWEHMRGVDIGTLDNPGWTLTVDLEGTRLEKAPFAPIAIGVGLDLHPKAADWLSCRVEGRKWKGAGDAAKLERLIREFLAWAEKHES